MRTFKQTLVLLRPLRYFAVALLYLATACASLGGSQLPDYSVILLGTATTEADGNSVWPRYINNKGEIVGYSSRGPFLYRGGRVHLLEPHEVLNVASLSINDRGVIAGSGWQFAKYPQPVLSFMLPTAGHNQQLDLLQASILPFPGFLAERINDHGTVLGWILENENVARPAVYHDGRLHELPRLVSAIDLNNRGQILGSVPVQLPPEYDQFTGRAAAIWSEGRMQSLGTLPGFLVSEGTAINDRGEVVGYCTSLTAPYGSRGFIYRDGVMRELPLPPNARSAFPNHLNNDGDILMWIPVDNPPYVYPRLPNYWFYSKDALHNFNALVAAASKWPLYELYIDDMNDWGEIVGVAEYQDGNGEIFRQGILIRPER